MPPTQQQRQQQQQSSLHLQGDTPRKRRRSREPNWGDFYKNGLPKEVIVIDDDSPDVDGLAAVTSNASTSALPQLHQRLSHSSQQAPKRRKRDDEEVVYDALYHNAKYSDSHTGTPRLNATPNSHSDRASALHNSSATSLSTHELDATQSGQKRKRTRQQFAHEQQARMKESEIMTDNFVAYHPPPYPPRKAPDVHIRVVHDVGFFFLVSFEF